MSASAPATTLLDPISFEVLRAAFTATCNEMALVVAKTAYSTPVNEGHDFAGGLYDHHGQLVSQGEFDLPAFVGLTILTVPEVIRQIGRENMEPGDIYIINDPYVASTHCNDIHFIKPIFVDGELLAFTSSTAHWSDVGGVVAGSLNCAARSHFEEGMRIPAITLFRRGEMNHDVVAILLHNMRQSWERLGDLNAQVAAVRAGEERIRVLIARHGVASVRAAMAEVQNYSERLARAAFSSLPDGVYTSEDHVDQDVHTGERKTIRLDFVVQGDHAVFDLTRSDGAAESGINCTIAACTSAIFIGLAAVLPPMPMNAGVMRAVEIKAKRGSIVWAQPPVGISGLAITSMDATTGAAMLAVGQALPERAVGLPSAIVNSTFAGADTRPTFDAPFINYIWAFGGTGGTKYKDGSNTLASPFGASSTNIPCELQERRYPVLYWMHQLLPDSGGPGETRGGCGLEQLIEPSLPGSLSNICNREKQGPAGILGGGAGWTSRLIVNPGTENENNLGTFAVNVPVGPGAKLSFWSNGAGGYGDPLDRPTERILDDIRDGYLTIPAAREQYGVIVRERDPRRLEYVVDAGATDRLRGEMRRARSAQAAR